MQQWLREAGIAYPRVTGGYKAMRGFLLDTLDRAIAECDFLVLGGMTGTGKTEVLRRLDDALDLEGHANHRGSSFGKRVSGQPTQINFDNALAIDILRNAPPDTRASWSRTRPGRGQLQPAARAVPGHAAPWPGVAGGQPGESQRILRDYVIDLGAEFVAAHGPEQGQTLFAQRLRQSLDNIARRLGGERHKRLAAIMDEALRGQAGPGRGRPPGLDRGPAVGILRSYVRLPAPAEDLAHRVRGDQAAVTQYLAQQAAAPMTPPHPGRPASRARDQAAWSDERTSSTGTGALRRMFSALLQHQAADAPPPCVPITMRSAFHISASAMTRCCTVFSRFS